MLPLNYLFEEDHVVHKLASWLAMEQIVLLWKWENIGTGEQFDSCLNYFFGRLQIVC